MTDYVSLPISHLHPSPLQMRHTMDPDKLQQLATSLKRDGQQRPVKARPHPTIEGDYEIIFGHRTMEAAKQAGLAQVEVIIEELTDEKVMWAQYAENEYREDPSDYDRAKWLNHMMDKFGYTQKQLGDRIGKDQSWVSHHLAMLKFDKIMSRDILVKITEKQARAILSADKELRPRVCEWIEDYYKTRNEIPPSPKIKSTIDQLIDEQIYEKLGIVPRGMQPSEPSLYYVEETPQGEDEAAAPELLLEGTEPSDQTPQPEEAPAFMVSAPETWASPEDSDKAFSPQEEAPILRSGPDFPSQASTGDSSKRTLAEEGREIQPQEYIADLYKLEKLTGGKVNEDWVLQMLQTKFNFTREEAKEELRRYHEPDKVAIRPVKPTTCRCPLCGRSGADRTLIQMKYETQGQSTLGTFIQEEMR